MANNLELRHRPRKRPLASNGERGVALLIALFAMMMMMMIAVEVTVDTSVDYATSSQAVNRLKAYYAARAGLELSLLRIKLFRKFAQQFGSQGDGKPSMIPMQMLDQIWQMPFMWPFPVPDALTIGEKDQIKKSLKESQMDAQYTTRIESESNKIDINDLGSPSQILAKATRNQILRIFKTQIETDQGFAERFRSYDFERLLNNITDWVTDGTTSLNGGDKTAPYAEIPNNRFLPPKQSFKTIDELHQVSLMTDEIYDLLAPRITVFGSKGININYATKELLMSLDPQINDTIIEAINTYKNEVGLFTGQDQFFSFLKSKGVNTRNLEADGQIPLYFDAEFNFRITANGTFGKSSREIVAITYDFDKVKGKLVDLLRKDDKDASKQTQQQQQQQPGTPPAQPPANPAPTNNQQAAQGRPNIVYWHED